MKRFTPLLIILLLNIACKKTNDTPSVSNPVDFTTTTYRTIGTFDDSGKPDYLGTSDVISVGLQSYVYDTFPEQTDLRESNPELLSSTAIADIALTSKSSVSITFVSQGTGFYNTIAFYTYPSSNPPASAKDIKDITYVFPNAGKFTALKAGDKVTIGTFDAGTSIGFVLLKNAWNPATKSINKDAVHFCSNDVLNPEVDPGLKKHAVITNYSAENKVLIGFEDIDRTDPECDHDFNDVVVYATVTQTP